MSTLRLLVIGAGPAAFDLHLPALARLQAAGEIALALICDLAPERAKAARKRFGFSASCGDAAAALARPDIDAVCIFGSAQMHWSLGLAALQAGKHLFVEKPIAPSWALACEMAQLAQAKKLAAAGGHNRRFFKSFAALHARDAGWRYGEAVLHRAEFSRPAPFGATTWLSANGIHALDALIFAMGGLPERISALSRDGMFSALMAWPDGAQASFLCDNNAGARREYYEFHAPGETCRIDAQGLTIEAAARTRTIACPMIGDGVAQELAAFLQAVRSGEPPLHAIATLAPSLYLAELIEHGFNGPVALPHPPETPRPPPAPRPILVMEAANLLPALARHMPHHPLISLADIGDSPRPDIEVVVIGGGARPIPDAILDKLPNLKIVGVAALSLERYGEEELMARGITLVNASAAYADSVAEFALGLAILGRRRAFASHDVMRNGGWGTARLSGVRRALRALRPLIRRAGLEPLALRLWRRGIPSARPVVAARGLAGARVGLIGWGHNARAFARKLTEAGAEVLAWSEHASAEDMHAAGAHPAALADVLAADIVSLHRALTPMTRYRLGAAELERLRPGAVLINVARGALIEPNALLARLRQGDIWACLDTFEQEPPPPSDRLRRLPNVFLTSHIAGGSLDMHQRAAEEVVQKIATRLGRQ